LIICAAMIRKLVLMALSAAVLLNLGACANAANRRALYSDTPPKGPWTDLAKKQEGQTPAGR